MDNVYLLFFQGVARFLVVICAVFPQGVDDVPCVADVCFVQEGVLVGLAARDSVASTPWLA